MKDTSVNPSTELFPKLILLKLFLAHSCFPTRHFHSCNVEQNSLTQTAKRIYTHFHPLRKYPGKVLGNAIRFMSIMSKYNPGKKVYYHALTLHSPLQQTCITHPLRAATLNFTLPGSTSQCGPYNGIPGYSTFLAHKYSQKPVAYFLNKQLLLCNLCN